MGACRHERETTGRHCSARSLSPEFHIILPPRERMGSTVSGAVGLVVAELYAHSRLSARTIVWGGRQTDLIAGISYRSISPSLIRLQSFTESYARKIAAAIPDTPQTYIEVHNRVNVYRVMRKRHLHSKVALFIHNDPHTIKGIRSPRERQTILDSASAIICVSEFVRQRFLDGIEDAKGKTCVIYNALDMAKYQRPDPAAPDIVFAGRMVPDKGALPLAQALCQVLPQHPDWSATFIGASKLSNNLPTTPYERQVIDTLKPLGKQVHYMGALPNAEVQTHFRRARIAVVPSLCLEALGRVALEAMANGCAVVTSGRGGLIEAVGDTGVIVAPEDTSQISGAIESLLNNPVQLEERRLQAYKRMAELFDVQKQADALDSLRENLVRAG
jgi:glycosyltransferase involved in cell wall biosynthesis